MILAAIHDKKFEGALKNLKHMKVTELYLGP